MESWAVSVSVRLSALSNPLIRCSLLREQIANSMESAKVTLASPKSSGGDPPGDSKKRKGYDHSSGGGRKKGKGASSSLALQLLLASRDGQSVYLGLYLGQKVIVKCFNMSHPQAAISKNTEESVLRHLGKNGFSSELILAVSDVTIFGGLFDVLLIRYGGQSLDKVSSGVAISLKSKVIASLRALHRKGVLHNDIRPPNFVVDRKGTVRVIDFGLSCFGSPKDPSFRRFCRGEVAEVKHDWEYLFK